MTVREMQIEFERRVRLISPDLIAENKLSSDTIFSFLNAYTERFVKQNYLQLDNIQSNSRAEKKNTDALKSLITRQTLEKLERDQHNTDLYTDRFILPDDYFLYIRSNSRISSNYKNNIQKINSCSSRGCPSDNPALSNTQVVPNLTIREEDVQEVESTYYNKPILVQPYVVLNSGRASDDELFLNVIHDIYTTVDNIDLVYYRKPKKFNITDVNSKCELDDSVHMEIVEGAVEMFITEAKYRLNTKQPKEQ